MSKKTKAKEKVNKGKPGKKFPGTSERPTRSSDFRNYFPVVGIGASAGGLEAIEKLLTSLPSDSGMAYIILTHQPSGHTSLLPDLLRNRTGMPVFEAQDGVRIKSDNIYVGMPGGRLAISNATLHRVDVAKKDAHETPIDYFFHSLALDQRERAIAIVLSGTGTDGTEGIKQIKAESGLVMAQEPESARYSGMPSSAIATGLVDYVLPPESMSTYLRAYANNASLARTEEHSDPESIFSEQLQKIFAILRRHTGHDFSGYKRKTLIRRIERRMNVHQILEPERYVQYLQENRDESVSLFKELLISVTNFFRDEKGWEALRKWIEKLIEDSPENFNMRIWIPGCATGEEAYSMAILLKECMEARNCHFEVQIFATDLDAEAITVARVGVYNEGITADVSSERLKRYFLPEESHYRVRKEIREMIVFAPHNVLKDPPFTRLNLISCRNLLIYLNYELQEKLLFTFHYALEPSGILFLGSSESTGAHKDLFEVLDNHQKIFRRQGEHRGARMMSEAYSKRTTAETTMKNLPGLAAKENHLSSQIERMLLKKFVPTSVVVNEGGDILYFHGSTGIYLEPSQGEPRINILNMAREGLQAGLSGILRECARTGNPVSRTKLQIESNEGFITADFSVSKINDPGALRDLLLVTFHPASRTAVASKEIKITPETALAKESRDNLEHELDNMRRSYKTALQEIEVSNEEFQSANEELQSTNEELETSKEELQSLNEELTTVNSELQAKLEELSRSNDDMQNLLNSTNIATVFLDQDLNIKRFTEQARKLVMLRHTDVGRPISDLASNLRIDDLLSICHDVLRTLVFKESEVETTDGSFYLMRITPYRTFSNVIDGLVLTFIDIGHIKEANETVTIAESLFKGIVNTVREPLIVLDDKLCIVSANTAFDRLFRLNSEDITGRDFNQLGQGKWVAPELQKMLEEIISYEADFDDYRISLEIAGSERSSFLLNARRLKQPGKKDNLILLAFEKLEEGAR